MGMRRFGRVNWLGLATLAGREVRRFTSIWLQTVMAPLVTAGLFLAIFTLAIGPTRGEVMGQPFIAFLAPGLMMMTVIQNAFSNTSSSLLVAKIQGNIVDTLMPPLSAGELVVGYLAGGVARGLFVAVAIAAIGLPLLGLGLTHPIWALAFVLLGGVLMGALGLLAAIIANKFDQMAAITNFLIVPLSFLSGTFYSVEAVPPTLDKLLHWNPIFYLIDGARFGVLGVSDSSPGLGLIVVLSAAVLAVGAAWWLMRNGYRLKS